MSHRHLIVTAAILAAVGVSLGAFGAHALAGAVKTWGLTEAEQAQRLETWEVAVRYQLFHSLALLGIGLLVARRPCGRLSWAAALLILGMMIFCGCLYVLVLSGIKILGAVVPIGGVCLIVGWATLAWAAWTMDEVAS